MNGLTLLSHFFLFCQRETQKRKDFKKPELGTREYLINPDLLKKGKVHEAIYLDSFYPAVLLILHELIW